MSAAWRGAAAALTTLGMAALFMASVPASPNAAGILLLYGMATTFALAYIAWGKAK